MISSLVIGQRLDIELVSVEEIHVGVGHELHPVSVHLLLVSCPLLETQVLIFQNFLVHHVRQFERGVLKLLLTQLLLNDVKLLSLSWLL